MTTGRSATRTLFTALTATVVAAACTAAGTPAPASPGPSGSPTASVVVPSGSPPASVPASSSASAIPSVDASPSVGASEPAPSGAFACAFPFQRPASRADLTAAVHDVRVGAHESYDRVVFEFLGTGVPEVRVDGASPPFVKDPSGLPLPVAGTAFLSIRMTQTSGAGYAQPDGQPTYTGPTSFQPGYTRLTALVEQGDFEGVFSWIAGLTGPMCYDVSELPNPARLVIDLRAP